MQPPRQASPGDLLPVIGWREWVCLPLLNIPFIKAKIDTGARTSSLHAFGLEAFRREGREWVRFSLHPRQRDQAEICTCEAPVTDRRHITDSGGQRHLRYVIATDIALGDYRWPIELTLAARETMAFRMLLGRSALQGRFLIDLRRSYCIGKRNRHGRAGSHVGETKTHFLVGKGSVL